MLETSSREAHKYQASLYSFFQEGATDSWGSSNSLKGPGASLEPVEPQDQLSRDLRLGGRRAPSLPLPLVMLVPSRTEQNQLPCWMDEYLWAFITRQWRGQREDQGTWCLKGGLLSDHFSPQGYTERHGLSQFSGAERMVDPLDLNSRLEFRDAGTGTQEVQAHRPRMHAELSLSVS